MTSLKCAGHALVKHEVLANELVAQARFLGAVVFDDTAFELVYVVVAFVAQVSAGFFATDAAGAVHHNGAFFVLFGQFFEHFDFFTERVTSGKRRLRNDPLRFRSGCACPPAGCLRGR